MEILRRVFSYLQPTSGETFQGVRIVDGKILAPQQREESEEIDLAPYQSQKPTDTLTSAYVHRIKPKQANLLLQDREEAEKVKRYVKQAGDALLCPVGSDSLIVRIPYTTEADLRRVAEQVGSAQRNQTSKLHHLHPAPEQPIMIQTDADLDAEFEKLAAGVSPTALTETRAETGETPEATTPPSPFGEFVRTRLAAIGLSQNKLAEQAGISKKDMSLYLNGGKPVSEGIRTQIERTIDLIAKQGNTLNN